MVRPEKMIANNEYHFFSNYIPVPIFATIVSCGAFLYGML